MPGLRFNVATLRSALYASSLGSEIVNLECFSYPFGFHFSIILITVFKMKFSNIIGGSIKSDSKILPCGLVETKMSANTLALSSHYVGV